MAEAANGHGHMNIADQKDTFSGFLTASLWGCTHIGQAVALLTFAFAIGLGWWAGVGATVVIAAIVALLFKPSGAWWAVQVAQLVLLVIGGALAGLISSLTG